MKNFIHNFIYIVLPSVVCFVCFYIFGISSFGASASVTMGQSASQSLANGLSSVFDLSSISASPDPLGLSIGLSRIYDNLDLYLYQNYDYDLTGTLNDTLEGKNDLLNSNMNISSELADSFVNKITNGLYTGVAELTGAGYALYKGVTSSLAQSKDIFFIGKAQDGIINETLGGTLTYVDDNTLSMYESSLTNAISNNALYDFSQQNHFLYGKTFHFVYGNWANYTINFSDPWVVGSLNMSTNGYYRIGLCSTYNYGENIPCSGVVVAGGRSHIIDYAYYEYYPTSVVIGNDTYYGGGLSLHCVDGYTSNCYESVQYGNLIDVMNGFVDSGSVVKSGVYSLSPDIEALIQDLLAGLKGHYVSTSDLDSLIDSLSNNGVITNDDVVIDGTTENVPVIDWSQDYIDTLQGIIEGILENSAVYDDVISDSNAGTPDPGPDPYYNTGTRVPNGFPSVFAPLIETIQIPFSIVSMFEPIFYVFTGGLSSLFSIWLLFPLFILVLLVIWALK